MTNKFAVLSECAEVEIPNQGFHGSFTPSFMAEYEAVEAQHISVVTEVTNVVDSLGNCSRLVEFNALVQ